MLDPYANWLHGKMLKSK